MITIFFDHSSFMYSSGGYTHLGETFSHFRVGGDAPKPLRSLSEGKEQGGRRGVGRGVERYVERN